MNYLYVYGRYLKWSWWNCWCECTQIKYFSVWTSTEGKSEKLVVGFNKNTAAHFWVTSLFFYRQKIKTRRDQTTLNLNHLKETLWNQFYNRLLLSMIFRIKASDESKANIEAHFCQFHFLSWNCHLTIWTQNYENMIYLIIYYVYLYKHYYSHCSICVCFYINYNN